MNFLVNLWHNKHSDSSTTTPFNGYTQRKKIMGVGRTFSHSPVTLQRRTDWPSVCTRPLYSRTLQKRRRWRAAAVAATRTHSAPAPWSSGSPAAAEDQQNRALHEHHTPTGHSMNITHQQGTPWTSHINRTGHSMNITHQQNRAHHEHHTPTEQGTPWTSHTNRTGHTMNITHQQNRALHEHHTPTEQDTPWTSHTKQNRTPHEHHTPTEQDTPWTSHNAQLFWELSPQSTGLALCPHTSAYEANQRACSSGQTLFVTFWLLRWQHHPPTALDVKTTQITQKLISVLALQLNFHRLTVV